MNDGPISAGKVVAAGPLGAGTDGPDVPGASNDIAAIASWSSIVRDTNRRAISLYGNFRVIIIYLWIEHEPLVFVAPSILKLQLPNWVSYEYQLSQMFQFPLSARDIIDVSPCAEVVVLERQISKIGQVMGNCGQHLARADVVVGQRYCLYLENILALACQKP
jgi:hypothetical protein